MFNILSIQTRCVYMFYLFRCPVFKFLPIQTRCVFKFKIMYWDFLWKILCFTYTLAWLSTHILCKMSLTIDSNFSHFLLLPGKVAARWHLKEHTHTHIPSAAPTQPGPPHPSFLTQPRSTLLQPLAHPFPSFQRTGSQVACSCVCFLPAYAGRQITLGHN